MSKQKPLAPDRQGKMFFVDSRRLIFEEGFNRRKDYGDLHQFLAEIKATGLDNLDPLLCYKKGEQWVVIKGHRRTMTIRIWEKEGDILMVPIMRARNGYNEEKAILEQIKQNHKDFTPLEKATVVSDMRAKGWRVEDIVKESGLSKVYVLELLSLADAPKKLIKLIEQGRVAPTFAMEMIAEGKVQEVIEKAERNPDLTNQDDIGDLFGQQAAVPVKPEKITRSDIKPNSVKIFKKFVPLVQEDQLPPEKLAILDMFKKFVAGELTLEDFQNYFS